MDPYHKSYVAFRQCLTDILGKREELEDTVEFQLSELVFKKLHAAFEERKQGVVLEIVKMVQDNPLRSWLEERTDWGEFVESLGEPWDHTQ